MAGKADILDRLGPLPRENPDLVGHDAAQLTFLRTFETGNLPHAWLITGPRGIGKATLAFRFARFILNQSQAGSGHITDKGAGLFGKALPPSAVPAAPDGLYMPPDNQVFQRVAASGHADLFTLEPGFNDEQDRMRDTILVGDVRKAIHFLSLTAAEGGWRIVIVDSADQMNVNASNALLKALEEPPERTLMILVSHTPGRLPATIRSRCCRLALSPLDDFSIADLLGKYAPDVTDTDKELLTALGEGSIGRALELAANGGGTLFRELFGVLSGLPQLDGGGLHALSDGLSRPQSIDAYRTTMNLLLWWLSRLIKGLAGSRQTELVEGESALINRLRSGADLEQWVEVWEKVTGTVRRADGLNMDRKQVVMNAFFSLRDAAATR